MKRLTVIFTALIFLSVSVKAQLSIVSSSPANGATNVSLTDTVKVTFSSPIDTSYRFHDFDRLVTNIAPDPSISFSADLKTVYITSPLMPNMDYYLLFYYVKAQDGSVLDPPVKIEFTTASAFTGFTISGKVGTEDSSEVDNSYALVGLSLTDPKISEPQMAYMAVADSDGNYSIPHVMPGKYFPLAVQDVDKNGVIDPDSADAITFATPINVVSGDISNVDFLFKTSSMSPTSFLELVSSTPADSAVGVSTTATLSFTFNMPLDTSFDFKDGGNLITNLGEIKNYHFSSDFQTIFLDTTLQANTDYFVAFYSLRAAGGPMLVKPAVVHFTTKSAYSGYSVSGKVVSKLPMLSPGYSFVGLSLSAPPKPDSVKYLVVTDSLGNFNLENVAPGTYYPFAVKDVNFDGIINPQMGGDPGVVGKPITITSSDTSNVILEYDNPFPPANFFLNVLNTYPADGAVNFGLNDTVKIRFSVPVDTSFRFSDHNGLLTNMSQHPQVTFNDSLTVMKIYSPLKPKTDYFVLLWGIRGLDHSVLTPPYLLNFTTDSSFANNKVSGDVIGNGPLKPFTRMVVGLANQPISAGEPTFSYFTVADSSGHFSFEHVRNGTYYPIAGYDGDMNGIIDPGEPMDALGSADSIVVNNSDVNNVKIYLKSPSPLPFSKAIHIADSLKLSKLPSDAQLVLVHGENFDTSGTVMAWNFSYLSKSKKKAYDLWMDWFQIHLNDSTDSNEYNWLQGIRPLGDSVKNAADPSNFIKNAFMIELTKYPPIGFTMHDTISINISVMLGDLHSSEFWDIAPDTSFYWGMSFTYYHGNDPWNMHNVVGAHKYLADYKTGTLIKQTGVKKESELTPENFALYQNYPNPFNPTTNIKFDVAKAGVYRLNIYNILGQKVATLLNKKLTPGSYRVTFNAANLPSGVYIYRLEGKNIAITKKMLLLK